MTSSDLRLNLGTFADTKATVEPISEKGKAFFLRHFGKGVVSAVIPKSQGEAFIGQATVEGLRVS